VRVAGDLPLTEIKGASKKENMYFGKLENSDLSGSWEIQ
jgi:hypothetical protein